MAEPLKYMYNDRFFKQLTRHCADIIPGFNAAQFNANFSTPEWDGLELKQRVRHVANAMAAQLTGKYKQDIKVVTQLIRHIQKELGDISTFQHIFLADYIEQYGIDYPVESMKAMEYATILSSCEFAIRPFIVKYPEQVMTQMLEWTKHKHASIRRLASEGCRPRLPWGMALVAFKKDPSTILPILEALKADPSEYVRKSVANNLNDIAKDNPDVVKDIIRRWQGSSKETDWILKHGSRTMLKKADEHTLSLFGVSAVKTVQVKDLTVKNPSISIGSELNFSFMLTHKESKPTLLRVEYTIYYMKASRTPTRKIFKVTENTFEPNRSYPIARKQSFKDMTTRKHYPGLHQIAIVVNGVEYEKIDFAVK